MNKRILLFVSLIFLFTSCKKDLFQFKYSEKKRLKIEELDFEYLQAKTKIQYEDGIQNLNANATIRIRQDSLIWISISSTGVEGIRSIIQKDSIFVIDRINKEYREFSFDSLQRAYNIPIDYDMVQGVLIGNLIKARKNNEPARKKLRNFFLAFESKYRIEENPRSMDMISSLPLILATASVCIGCKAKARAAKRAKSGSLEAGNTFLNVTMINRYNTTHNKA